MKHAALKHAAKRSSRLVAALVAGSFLLGTASPGFAAEAAMPLPEPKTSLVNAASERVEALSREELASAAAQDATTAPSADSGGFFKTSKGKVALVLLVAATGLTVYSKYNDRVKSVIR